jgi:hypothetical protein
MSGNGRFFVTVIAPDREALQALRQHDLDLFKPTARPAEAGEFEVDGLLTLEEIGQLASAGYRVVVHEDAGRRARGQAAVQARALDASAAERAAGAPAAPAGTPTSSVGTPAIGFQDWLKGMEEEE